jgi:signal transduction histidine kinase
VRLPKLVRTTAFRLTLRYVALFGLAVLILFGVIWTVMTDYEARHLDSEIRDEVESLRINATDIATLTERIGTHATFEANQGMYWLLQARDGRVLAGNMPAMAAQAGWFERVVPRADKPRKQRRIRVQGVSLPDDLYLAVGLDPKSQKQLREVRELVTNGFVIAAAATLLLMLAGGTLVGARLLRRVEGIGRTSREIAEGDLGRRLPLGGNDDELDHLATDLNRMLDRMQIQFETVKQVSSDIAHDLRTPLTRLRQRLERARDTPTARAIEHAIEETDAILATFAALLRIAEIESDAQVGRFAPVDLTETLRTLVEVYQSMADERGQALLADIPDALTVTGDRAMLAQMVANLLENALRHTPAGSTIRVVARAVATGVELLIEDNGAGIPTEESEKVFRRFYRREASRTSPGNGLGLALVAAIAARHHAQLTLEDAQPGLRVRLSLPA